MLVIADKPGQLGNRLLVFANVMATSRRLGTRVLNPAFDEYAPLFNGTRNNVFCAYPRIDFPTPAWLRRAAYWLTLRTTSLLTRVKPHSRIWHVIRLEWGQTLDMAQPEFERLQHGRLAILQGWLLRDLPGLREYRKEIVEFFRLPAPQEQQVESREAILREGADLLIGVHLRQGDYNEDLDRAFFLESPEYVTFMRQLEVLFHPKRIRFVVSSNVRQDPTLFGAFDVALAFGSPPLDMYLLAKCDYVIGPPSSFNFWASYVGQTPLFTVLSPNDVLSLRDACTFPTVRSEAVSVLYLGA